MSDITVELEAVEAAIKYIEQLAAFGVTLTISAVTSDNATLQTIANDKFTAAGLL